MLIGGPRPSKGNNEYDVDEKMQKSRLRVSSEDSRKSSLETGGN